jgi:hypothetical protein
VASAACGSGSRTPSSTDLGTRPGPHQAWAVWPWWAHTSLAGELKSMASALLKIATARTTRQHSI